MKKILIFSLVYYPRFIGGAEVAVKEITDRILPAEISFDMVTLRKSALKSERLGNINVYRVGFGWQAGDNVFLSRFKIYKYLFPFFALFKAILLHRKNRYDAVWSIMANYAGFGALFFKLFHPKIPFVLTLQEGDPISYIKRRVGIFYPLFKMIFTRADRIQTISNYLADWAKDMGANATAVTVIPNGVSVKNFQFSIFNFQRIFKYQCLNLEDARRKVRRQLGFSNEDVVLVTVSRLVEKNAIANLIESLQYLPRQVKLLIIGTGVLEGNLKLKVANLKLEERVHFAGFIAHEKLPTYLWASDIFVRPSLSEGMGNSFIEAMASGLPVIATQVGGIVDFLRDGETGLFCEVGNPKSIAQKIEKLIKDSESRQYIVENASGMVKDKYDWSLIAKRMKEEVFCNLFIPD